MAKDQEQETRLRILAWWRSNDPCRDDPQALTRAMLAAYPARVNNLKALASLLNGKDDQIMKAEVLRELGEFDASVKLLKTIKSPKYKAIVSQLLKLCESKDFGVRLQG